MRLPHNTTRSALALILVAVYAAMWALLVHDMIGDDGTGGTSIPEQMGEYVGIVSTMTVLVTLVIQFYFRRSAPTEGADPVVLLKRRLANGDITDKEFDTKLRLLRTAGQSSGGETATRGTASG